jgi:hypothetical protein
MVALQPRFDGRRHQHVAAAQPDRAHRHAFAGVQRQCEGFAAVARLQQPFRQPELVAASMAVHLGDDSARAQSGRAVGRDDGQVFVHAQRAHPGDPGIVVADAIGRHRIERQFVLVVAAAVGREGGAHDGRTPFDGGVAERAHVGHQGGVQRAAVVHGRLAGAAAQQGQRKREDDRAGVFRRHDDVAVCGDSTSR